MNRQRRYHRQFRIAAPTWPDPVSLTGLVEQLTIQSTVDEQPALPEKDLAEAARVLGVAEGTLKARLHRARELLRRRCASLGPRTTEPPMEES